MTNLFDISGKVAIITGASRGIGQSIAETFAEAGAKVVLSSRKQESLDGVVSAIKSKGGEAMAIAAHNGNKEALQALAKKTIEIYGRVDILVNNAATNPHFGTLLDAEDSMWQKTIEVNLLGNVWLTQAIVPSMRQNGGGKIVNIASVAGITPGNFQGIYSASKAALISLTKTLAMELGPDNIQVNAIAPGLIQTKFAQVLWENDEIRGRVEAKTAIGRIGQPVEIASVAQFLASPASNYTTGSVFIIDGGLMLSSL